MNLQFPRFLRPLFGKSVQWKVKSSSKVIYLTFDDGPVPEVTPQVLDILDAYGWKATFFCVGDNVRKYPELYQEVIRRGHRTANHTFNHIKGFNTETDDYVNNVALASQWIKSDLFRPPHGHITRKQIRALKSNYRIIMWDVITHDYNRNLSPMQVYKNVENHLRDGSIVVFHDSIKAQNNVLIALPKALEFWIAKGYRSGLL
ncbi:MAG: polysaccharide deacetylase family protein [Paludibacter sp.]|nr:polysaccharide deacetylase family protein [Paludibacter sp.]